MMNVNKYNLEFMLSAKSASLAEIKNSLLGLSDKVEVSACADGEFRISISTLDPTLIFDTCAQFGRIKSVKIDEFRS